MYYKEKMLEKLGRDVRLISWKIKKIHKTDVLKIDVEDVDIIDFSTEIWTPEIGKPNEECR